MLNKPINPYPHNRCVNTENGLNIKYEVSPNGINGCYTVVNELDTGICVASHRQSYDDNTTQVSLDIELNGEKKEYSWNSVYWQNPMGEGQEFDVYDYDHKKSVLRFSPTSYSNSQPYIPTYKGSGISQTSSGICSYMHDPLFICSIGIYDHEEEDKEYLYDETVCCYKGTLSDYNGYQYFTSASYVWGTAHEQILDCFELGIAPIFELYSKDNILIAKGHILAYCYRDRYKMGETGTANTGIYIVDCDISRYFSDAITNKLLGVHRFTYKKEYQPHDQKFYNIQKICISDGDSDSNTENFTGTLLSYNNEYSYIQKCEYNDGFFSATIYPPMEELQNSQMGESINIYEKTDAEFNISPTYYFRYKSAPLVGVVDSSTDKFSSLSIKDGTNVLQDVKCQFGITYTSSDCKMNYFYLYMYVLNSKTGLWEVQERSPMLYNLNDTHEFIGLSHNQKYKVIAVLTDEDGDEWSSEELCFTVGNYAAPRDYGIEFNPKTTTVDISLDKLFATPAFENAKNISLEFYKHTVDDIKPKNKLEYAGGGMAKVENNIVFSKWSDYNICNDTYYNYYVRVIAQNQNGLSGKHWYQLSKTIHTEFCGTSILSLEKINDTQLEIANSFNIFYKFDKDMGELNNELSREYMNSFSKYPRELKGHQNYISGSLSGLLGDESNGLYVEPKGIRKAWNNFVDDNTIKLYRGLDGETMIISIDTNRVKPYYFPEVGVVNEVSITFKEIASAGRYTIFSTGR